MRKVDKCLMWVNRFLMIFSAISTIDNLWSKHWWSALCNFIFTVVFVYFVNQDNKFKKAALAKKEETVNEAK